MILLGNYYPKKTGNVMRMNTQMNQVTYVVSSTIKRKALRSSLDAAVQTLCEKVRMNPTHPLTLKEMEILTGYSRRSLENEFHRQFGCSPVKWQQTTRLSMAHDYLISRTGKVAISDVACEFGFASPSRFIAYYKRFFGETPNYTATRMIYLRNKTD